MSTVNFIHVGTAENMFYKHHEGSSYEIAYFNQYFI